MLKCTSSYRASPEDSNIRTIPHLKQAFNFRVGLSGHTMGVGGAVESVALGAVFIGKHFILSRADCGVDAACSLEPDELKLLVVETERGGQGTVTNSRSMRKLESLKRRRSLYFKRNLKSGAKISRDDVVLIRPARGLAPSLISVITGRTLKQDVSVGDSVT